MGGRVTVQVAENNKAAVFVRNLEPYDAIRILITTALALLEGRAEVTFNDGPPLTPEEEEEMISSMTEESGSVTGGHRGN